MKNNKFTEKQIKELIDSIIILVDSREKLPNHITDCFDKYGVNWRKEKLNSGDYSCVVPPNEKLNFKGIDFREKLCIERKMSADEISVNLSTNKERFNREFERSNADILILIENNSYKDIAKGEYKSKLHPKSFLGLLHSFSDKHNSPFIFLDKEVSALWIYNTYKYKLKNYLKLMNNKLK